MPKKAAPKKAEKGKRKSSVARKSSIKSPKAIEPPKKEEPQPEVKKYDPCRFVPESCCEELGCRPNSYPGLLEEPEPMAIVGSESGSYASLCKLLQGGFRCTNRVFMMTPWGNYVIFRVKGSIRTVYFIFDGCTCNVNRFRYYDLNIGTAGLLFYKSTHEILHYMMHSKMQKEHFSRVRKDLVDDLCREYSNEFCHLAKSKV